jgi:molybdopterin/thiamine biosynthesis adenylyltransferase
MNEILCAGAGRGGHGVLPRLADRGARRFAILDDDRIEAVNLPNLRLDERFLGLPKAKSLAWELAAGYGAVVRWADVKFSPDLLAQRSPFADMIYHQSVILGLTDNLESQVAIALTAARLEIPFVASRVFVAGGGDVFVQLDVDRGPCFGCFTAFIRRADRPAEPLRGRDLPVGAGDRVDDFTAEATAGVLGLSAEARRRVFAPHRRFGMPSAWEISPDSETLPIFFQRDTGCPICGDEARRQRRAPAALGSTSRRRRTGRRHPVVVG